MTNTSKDVKKIVDCFTFYNEIDLLNLRLEYLYDTVDHFVIVEADTTFNGKSKPLIFDENKALFKKYEDKIVHVCVTMKSFEETEGVAWKREEYQRNQIKKGVASLSLNQDDFLLIGDVDEIPRKEILAKLKNNTLDASLYQKELRFKQQLKFLLYGFKKFRHGILGKKKYILQKKFIKYVLKQQTPPMNFKMDYCNFYVNYKQKDQIWDSTQCIEVRCLHEFSIEDIRNFRKFPTFSISNSGWHFSYLGGRKIIKNKLRNFSHQEFNIPEIVSDEYIDICIEKGYSMFEYYKNKDAKPVFEKLPIDEYLPENLAKIAKKYEYMYLN